MSVFRSGPAGLEGIEDKSGCSPIVVVQQLGDVFRVAVFVIGPEGFPDREIPPGQGMGQDKSLYKLDTK
ncbi:MAG TPA: hypothetical protein PLE43_04995 [Alphaproteobacteria bacterium]|nr:hypothetical protein [Alphaproteobacteria bacterium]